MALNLPEKPFSSSPLIEAKRALSIPDAWQALGLPGTPKASCFSPFREDRHPSFSIFDEGRAFVDHATGDKGSVVEFVMLATGQSEADACRTVIELAGTGKTAARIRPKAPRTKPEPKRELVLPPIDRGTAMEMDQLARSRGIPTFAALEILHGRGMFHFYESPEGRAWLMTDSERRAAQGRLTSGQAWHRIGAKAMTIKGSSARWPICCATITPETSTVFITEGCPDALAAVTALFMHDSDSIPATAFCAMLGAAQAIHEEALELFRGKHIRIFSHSDAAGRKATLRWAAQLRELKPASLTAWRSESPDADLNDEISKRFSEQDEPDFEDIVT